MFLPYASLHWQKIHVRVPHSKGLPLTDENKYGEEAESNQWIGADLDGTLAILNLGRDLNILENPFQTCLKGKDLDTDGSTVKILTARSSRS